MSFFSWLWGDNRDEQLRREALLRLTHPPRRSYADLIRDGASGNPRAWRVAAQVSLAARQSAWRPLSSSTE